MKSRNNRESKSLLRKLFKEPLPLESETTWFILLSAMDVFMTYILLRQGHFFESNPVARFFLHGWGIRGMVYFKFGMVAFITVIAQVVARSQLETARGILFFGTLVVGAVVIYSFTLFMRSL